LLKKKRKSQEICVAKRQFQWNQLDPKYLLDPSESKVDERAIFRLHSGVALEEEDDSRMKEMIQHVKDLHSKATRYTIFGAVVIPSKHLKPSLSFEVQSFKL
jgi:hypothetical protein